MKISESLGVGNCKGEGQETCQEAIVVIMEVDRDEVHTACISCYPLIPLPPTTWCPARLHPLPQCMKEPCHQTLPCAHFLDFVNEAATLLSHTKAKAVTATVKLNQVCFCNFCENRHTYSWQRDEFKTNSRDWVNNSALTLMLIDSCSCLSFSRLSRKKKNTKKTNLQKTIIT